VIVIAIVGLTYDLEGVGNDTDSHELFTIVATVHHEGVGETLNDGALGLSETLDGISTSRVRDVDRCSDLDVIAVGKKSQSKCPVSISELPTSLSTSGEGIIR
jgi:hypothetical protein